MRSFKKGQYVLCRYHGAQNGDLIVGRVKSVRATGEVILDDLLSDTGKPRVKQANILAKRNVIAGKRDADRVIHEYHDTFQNRAKARICAVSIAQALLQQPSNQLPLIAPNDDRVAVLVASFRSLTLAEQMQFSQTIYADVLHVFGVEQSH